VCPTLVPAVIAAPTAEGAQYPPGLGIRLLDASLSRKKDPRARISIDDFVHPGDTLTRHFLISDGDNRPFNVKIYARAAKIVDGNFAIVDKQPGEIPQWTSLDRSSATIPPQSAVTVTVKISIPKTAPKGEYYGALLAELPPPPTHQGVAVGARVGLRVYLAVGPGGEPASDFTVDTLTAARNEHHVPVVTAEVHNTGGRALDMAGTLRLDHGPGGLSAGPFPATLGTVLAPGQTEPVVVVLSKDIPDGPWHARIDLQSGLLKRAAEGEILFPSGAGETSKPVAAKSIPLTKNRDVIVPIAIALLLFLMILLFLIWWRRRKRDDDDDRPATS
jgi:hypothetical protein